MFIELVELLRCVREHDESWLVASIEQMEDRSIRKGTLGCPICGETYPLRDGVADFTGGKTSLPQTLISSDAYDIAMRAGGLLALDQSAGVVVLGGSWAGGSGVLASVANVRVVAVNAPTDTDESSSIALVRADGAIPLAMGSCAGIALDDSFDEPVLASAVRCVGPGGRIVGPRSLQPPAGLSVLARDENYWVAEKPPAVTSLRRANR